MKYFIREHEGVRFCQQYVPNISCSICLYHEDTCSHSARFLPGSLPPSTAWLSISRLLTPFQCQTVQTATSQFNLEWPLAFCTTCLFLFRARNPPTNGLSHHCSIVSHQTFLPQFWNFGWLFFLKLPPTKAWSDLITSCFSFFSFHCV